MVGAIDGSLMPIIAPSNASVHPPNETVDRVDSPLPPHTASRVICLRSFFLCFVAFAQSVHFMVNSNSDTPCCCCSIPYTPPNNSLFYGGLLIFTDYAKSSKSSAHLHSYYAYYLPLFPMITLNMLMWCTC